VGPFDPGALVHPWRHPDERVDALQGAAAAIVGRSAGRSRREVFETIWTLAHEGVDDPCVTLSPFPPGAIESRSEVPWLDEPWYC
jgi:hypothetical protein